jgi:hypothetical protein
MKLFEAINVAQKSAVEFYVGGRFKEYDGEDFIVSGNGSVELVVYPPDSYRKDKSVNITLQWFTSFRGVLWFGLISHDGVALCIWSPNLINVRDAYKNN